MTPKQVGQLIDAAGVGCIHVGINLACKGSIGAAETARHFVGDVAKGHAVTGLNCSTVATGSLWISSVPLL